MLSETLKEGLSRYRIGSKLRKLRLKKSMGLVQLSEHSGLSPAMLSKLERDKLVPTLPTLLRIAMVFSVGLDFFFTDEDEAPPCTVVRKADRISMPNDPKGQDVSFHFESLDFAATDRRMSSYYAEFEPRANGHVPRHSHTGEELIFVIKGRMILSFEESEETLRAGDAAHFDSALPHGYCRDGQGPCSAIVVTLEAQ